MPASKQEIESVRKNLPKPEDPPVKSDFNSNDPSTVNVGSGRDVASDISTGAGSTSGLREPASKKEGVDLSQVGREGKDGLDGPPKDAAAR